MESSEREPSYYEVALTHRQVMVGLVVALTTVVVAFFAGIWIGRDRYEPIAATAGQSATSAPAATEAEKLTFFGDKGAAAASKPATKPAPIAPPSTRPAPVEEEPPAPSVAENESAKLRQTLEAEMAAHRVQEVEPPAVSPGARVTREPAAVPAPSTSAAKPAPQTGAFWIQVYSSTNGERAKEISTKLVKGGFPVRTLGPTSAGGPNYRVRVGPYTDRAKADRAATRLRRELKLDTWITDAP